MSAMITTRQAIDKLLIDATRYPSIVQDMLAEAARRDPEGIKALLKAAGAEALGDVATAAQLCAEQLLAQKRFPLVIGQPVTEQGIPFGQLKSGRRTINLYLIPDYLRDASSAPVELNGNQAIEAVTALNEGLKYGNGYEDAICSSVSRGEFKDGTLFLARR
jgi:hypothetical protein